MTAPRRISVVGNAGSGKSTLAVALGRRLGLPVIHLDRHFWRSGWVETPRDEWPGIHRSLVARERWIIDGNYRGTMSERLARSDAAVFLDLPRTACLLAVLGRAIRLRGRSRPDLAAGCPEKIPDRAFLEFVWSYPADFRPSVLAKLAEFEAAGGRVVRMKTRREARGLAERC